MADKLRWVLVKSRYACAGVGVDSEGIIRDAAPIYRKLIGQRLDDILRHKGYRVHF